MSTVTIIGAGMMGSALCWPLSDNHHTVRLVGTILDEEIIASVKTNGLHPTLKRSLPQGVTAWSYTEIPPALQGADLVVSGVSSFGVDWFYKTAGDYLAPEVPVIAVTKGLEDQPNGDLLVLPEAGNHKLPAHLQGRVSLNAIGGPCISHELAARRQELAALTVTKAATVRQGRLAKIHLELRTQAKKQVVTIEVPEGFVPILMQLTPRSNGTKKLASGEIVGRCHVDFLEPVECKDGRVRYLHRGYQSGYEDTYDKQIREMLKE